MCLLLVTIRKIIRYQWSERRRKQIFSDNIKNTRTSHTKTPAKVEVKQKKVKLLNKLKQIMGQKHQHQPKQISKHSGPISSLSHIPCCRAECKNKNEIWMSEWGGEQAVGAEIDGREERAIFFIIILFGETQFTKQVCVCTTLSQRARPHTNAVKMAMRTFHT